MTGPGTNTYLIGVQRFAVIDPGPHDLVHVEGILEAAGGRVATILATHTHRTIHPQSQLLHSPLERKLSDAVRCTWP